MDARRHFVALSSREHDPPTPEEVSLMRFFLAGRDRVTGSVHLVSESTFSSRQDALDSLSSLLPVDGSFDGLDLFVADIEQATPVVVYKPAIIEPPVGTPVEAPMADAWESPSGAVGEEPLKASVAGAEPVEEPYADAVIAELEAAIAAPELEPAGESPEPLPLVEALRRAADRMEAEGVVAPEPAGESTIADDPTVAEVVSEEPVPAETSDEPAPVATLEEEPAPVAAPEEVPVAADELEDVAESAQTSEKVVSESMIESPVATQWPWEAAGVESAPVRADENPVADLSATSLSDLDLGSEPALGVGTEVAMGQDATEMGAGSASAGIEQHSADAVSMLPSPADEFVPKPVIMGDYGATIAADVAVSTEPVFEAEPVIAVDEFAAAILPEESHRTDVSEEPVFQVPMEPMGLRAVGEPSEDAGTGGAPLPEYVPAAAAAAPEPEDSGSLEQFAQQVEDAQPEPLDDLLAAIADPTAPIDEPKAYSHSGIDMNAYTCQDCVYVGTCPKANDDSPATCGSFQWKSV